jgi:predicted protein tyrosine phosphatase
MIAKLKITDLKEAEEYSFRNNKDWNVWISVVEESDRRKIQRMSHNFNKKIVRHFSQFFADWSDEDGFQWKHLEKDAPKKIHVKRIIYFLRPFCEDDKAHRLGVNCFAGISRSTAVGLIALVMSGRTIEDALTELLKNRPEAWPNLRMLKFASEILGCNLHDHVVEWKKSCMGCLWRPPERLQPKQI